MCAGATMSCIITLWVQQWRPRHGANRDADRSFARYIGTLSSSSPDDRGLGTVRALRSSIRFVAVASSARLKPRIERNKAGPRQSTALTCSRLTSRVPPCCASLVRSTHSLNSAFFPVGMPFGMSRPLH